MSLVEYYSDRSDEVFDRYDAGGGGPLSAHLTFHLKLTSFPFAISLMPDPHILQSNCAKNLIHIQLKTMSFSQE